MVELIFITPDGDRVLLNVPPEGTVMEAATANNVPGIIADCGGSMVCGTCHALVSEEWQSKLPEQEDMEKEILEFVPDPQPNARLTCQLKVTEALNGIEFQVPESQY